MGRCDPVRRQPQTLEQVTQQGLPDVNPELLALHAVIFLLGVPQCSTHCSPVTIQSPPFFLKVEIIAGVWGEVLPPCCGLEAEPPRFFF